MELFAKIVNGKLWLGSEYVSLLRMKIVSRKGGPSSHIAQTTVDGWKFFKLVNLIVF